MGCGYVQYAVEVHCIEKITKFVGSMASPDFVFGFMTVFHTRRGPRGGVRRRRPETRGGRMPQHDPSRKRRGFRLKKRTKIKAAVGRYSTYLVGAEVSS